MTLIEEAVPLTEVARRVNLSVDEVREEAGQLQLFIGVDWKLEPSVSTEDAHRLVTGSARHDHDHQRAHEQYTIALEEWQRERESVRREAFDAEWKSKVKEGWNSGSAADRGHAAAREALEEFDRRNPQPVFNQPADTGLKSLVRRVMAGTR